MSLPYAFQRLCRVPGAYISSEMLTYTLPLSALVMATSPIFLAAGLALSLMEMTKSGTSGFSRR